MKNELRQALDPGDDGQAFTEAVLIKASGALHRRSRQDVRAGTWQWLEQWARPWLVTAVLALALAAAALPLLPLLPRGGSAAALDPVPEADILAAPQPEDMLVVTMDR